MNDPFLLLLIETKSITFVQINDAISILTRQKKVMNRDKRCENPHLWYCSCWGFCCSVPCSFEKLHRHKLKTIFNFKITEWVVKWSSSHGGSPVFWFLSQPFLSNLLPKKKKKKKKMSQEVCLNTVRLRCFFLFCFVFILACFSCWWFPVIDGIIYSINGTVPFVAEVGAEKVSLVSISNSYKSQSQVSVKNHCSVWLALNTPRCPPGAVHW